MQRVEREACICGRPESDDCHKKEAAFAGIVGAHEYSQKRVEGESAAPPKPRRKKEMAFGLCKHGGKQFYRFEVDWPNRFKIRALPFQKGDKVETPRGKGVITAVGISGLRNILYRVGHNYWYGFQLAREGR